MSEKGGSKSEEEAYDLALTEFYQVRLSQELKEKEEKSLKTKSSQSIEDALLDLEIMESRKVNPKSESILEIEKLEIKEGQEFSQMQEEA